MRFLITGAGGQLGTEWVRYLTDRDANYHAFGSAELDLTDKQKVTEVIEKYKPEVVINCAAYTAVDRAEDEPDKAFGVNRNGVINLIEACSMVSAKLVHYSTDYVFSGKREDQNKYPDGYPEDAPRNPVNRYGESKMAGEDELGKSSIEWLLIRVSWLCSPGGTNFVNTMLRLGEENKSVNVVDDQFGSPTYTFDVTDKTMSLLESGASGIFHISSSGMISWADFADEIFRSAGMTTDVNRIPASQFPTKAKRPAFSLLSKNKLYVTGLKPMGWETGLHHLLTLKNE